MSLVNITDEAAVNKEDSLNVLLSRYGKQQPINEDDHDNDMKMCVNIKTAVKMECTRLEMLNVKVRGYQGFEIKSSTFCSGNVNIREDNLKVISYVYDLKELQSCYSQCKKMLKDKSIQIKINEMKAFYQNTIKQMLMYCTAEINWKAQL